MKYLLALLIMTISYSVMAEGLGRVVHVKRIFSEGESRAGFYTQEALPECKWGLMYISLSNESGKAMFSLILTAKATNASLVRIDYTKSEDDKCYVNGLHLQ